MVSAHTPAMPKAGTKLQPLKGVVELESRVAKFQWTCERCGRAFWAESKGQGLVPAQRHQAQHTCTRRISNKTLEEWERGRIAKWQKNTAVPKSKVGVRRGLGRMKTHVAWPSHHRPCSRAAPAAAS